MPEPMGIETNKVLAWLTAAVASLIAFMFRGHDKRIDDLEKDRQTKDEAREQRMSIDSKIDDTRTELKEFRTEATGKFEQIRIENSGRFDRLSGQLQDISARLPKSRR